MFNYRSTYTIITVFSVSRKIINMIICTLEKAYTCPKYDTLCEIHVALLLYSGILIMVYDHCLHNVFEHYLKLKCICTLT